MTGVLRLHPEPVDTGDMNSLLRAICLLTFGLAQLGAQTSAGRSELRLTARSVVGFRLNVRPEGAARVINRVAGATEIEYPVITAANSGWALTAERPAVKEASDSRVEVMGADGEWHPLNAGGGAITVGRGQPTNGLPMVLRLRVRGAAAGDIPALRLMMAPSDGSN